VTVDTGGALTALANSVAFYVNTDNGAQQFQIDNIIASGDSATANSLSLTSLMA